MAQPDFGTTLWKAIERLKKEQGYSKRKIVGDLARICEVSPDTVQKWKVRSIPSRATVELIAKWGVDYARMDSAWVHELCRTGDQFGCADFVKGIFAPGSGQDLSFQRNSGFQVHHDNRVKMYRIGAIELPVIHLTGSPRNPFKMDEVTVHFRPETLEERGDYPVALKRVKSYLLQKNIRRYAIKHLADHYLPRLDGFEQEPEDKEDNRGKLHLYLSQTTFGATLATNNALDFKVIPQDSMAGPRMISIREAFCSTSFEDLSTSVLSNPVGVEVVVLSRNNGQTPRDQLIVRRRSQNVIFYNGYYQASASGYMTIAHADSTGVPNPFVTAVEEAQQEVADSLEVSPEYFSLTSIALLWETLHPSVLGYIETPEPISHILGDFRRDAYEGILGALPFEPETVLSHIARQNWTPMSAMAVISTLLAFFPYDEVNQVAKSLPALKTWQDYLTNL